MALAVLDPARLAFRPLELADLPKLHRWYAEPHAAPWFADRANEIDHEYGQAVRGEVAIFAYVIVYEGVDIGLINWERFGDFPEQMAGYEVTDPDYVNIDVSSLITSQPTRLASLVFGEAFARTGAERT